MTGLLIIVGICSLALLAALPTIVSGAILAVRYVSSMEEEEVEAAAGLLASGSILWLLIGALFCLGGAPSSPDAWGVALAPIGGWAAIPIKRAICRHAGPWLAARRKRAGIARAYVVRDGGDR
jgi:hypothetical protein